MLEFVKTCPEPVSLWNTINKETISPFDGYSSDQLKFLFFLSLRIGDFAVAKSNINSYLSESPEEAHSTLSAMLTNIKSTLSKNYSMSVDRSDFQTLKLLADSSGVYSPAGLELPSIYARQLFMHKSPYGELLQDIFQHTDLTNHILNDTAAHPEHLTAFIARTASIYDIFASVKIVPSETSIGVSSKVDTIESMRNSIVNACITAHDEVVAAPISIFPFKLDTPEAEPADSTPSTSEVKVGSRLRCHTPIGERTKDGIYVVVKIDEAGAVFITSDASKRFSIACSAGSEVYEYFDVLPDLSWTDIKVGTEVVWLKESSFFRVFGKTYRVSNIDEAPTFTYISDDGDAKGTQDTVSAWSTKFAIKEL